MSFQFLPLGAPVSTSFAISASYAQTSVVTSLSASIAEKCTSCPGPTGPSYTTRPNGGVVNAVVP